MSDQWFQAKLNPDSPRYLIWRKIFNQDEIPIRSPIPVKGRLDGQEAEYIYLIDWTQVRGEEARNLVQFVMEKYDVTKAVAVDSLQQHGFFPIRRDDCIISATLPHFL